MRIMILSFLIVTGCSYTELRDPKTGSRVLFTQADATNVSYSGPGYSFHADSLNHSKPTRAMGSVIGTALSGAVPGITAVGMAIK